MVELEVATEKSAKKPRVPYGYVIVGAGLLLMVATYGAADSFGVFFKPVSRAFDWTRAETSGASALYQIIHGVTCIIAGRLGDRLNPRLVISVCGVILGAGFLLMSQVNALWQFYLFYGALVGTGMAAYVPVMSVVARWWFARRRGLMTGIVVSGIGIGIAIMPPLATQMVESYGWSLSYMVIGLITMFIVVGAAQFLRRGPAGVAQSSAGGKEDIPSVAPGSQGLTFSQALHTSTLWLLGFAWFTFLFALQVVMVHLIPYATDLDITPILAASIISVVGGMSIVSRVVIGGASDRIGVRASLIIGYSLVAGGMFFLLPAKSLGTFYLFAAIFGLGYGGIASMNSLVVAEFFGLRAHGAILGMILCIATIGGALGPIVAGKVFDVTGGYFAAFIITALLSVTGVGAVVLVRIKSRKAGVLPPR